MAATDLSSDQARQLLIENMELVDQVARRLQRRFRLTADEADELRSLTYLRLVDNDYAALRRFEGRGRFSTYLMTLAGRTILDRRNRRWGKWRPSRAAERLGVQAVSLEELMFRDGFSMSEAVRIVAGSQPGASHPVLEELASGLPSRCGRYEEPLDDHQLASDSRTDAELCERERQRRGRHILGKVNRMIARLSAEDQKLLRLRFEQGLTIRRIAKTLQQDCRPLYRRFAGCLARLREELEAEGVNREDALASLW